MVPSLVPSSLLFAAEYSRCRESVGSTIIMSAWWHDDAGSECVDLTSVTGFWEVQGLLKYYTRETP